MKRSYRISNWRFDVRKSTYREFSTEGESEEECDEKAKDILEDEAGKETNQWEEMNLVRIDTPAVAEKVTPIGEVDKKTRKLPGRIKQTTA